MKRKKSASLDPEIEALERQREALQCCIRELQIEHDLSHLANARGILQADGYKGYAKLYQPEPNGVLRLREAACWAHLRRDFHDFWASTKSEIALEALDRIGTLYDIERDINGQPADVRHAARQQLSQPKVTAFFAWSEQQLLRIPGKSELAKAFRYGLSRQEAFSLFLTDGRVAIDNNPAERALRPIGIGRKNWLFAPSRDFGPAKTLPGNGGRHRCRDTRPCHDHH
jgi:transposase